MYCRAWGAGSFRSGTGARWRGFPSAAGWKGLIPGVGRRSRATQCSWSRRRRRPCGWPYIGCRRRVIASPEHAAKAQAAGVDAAGLLGRAGLHCPVRWSALEGQWVEKFPGLSIDLRVEAALETET